MDPASPIFIPQNILPQRPTNATGNGGFSDFQERRNIRPTAMLIQPSSPEMQVSSPVFVPRSPAYGGFRPVYSPQNMVNAQNALIQEQKWRSTEFEEVMKHNFKILEERYDYIFKHVHEQNFAICKISKELINTKDENFQLKEEIKKLQEEMDILKEMQKEEQEKSQKFSPKKKWHKK